MGEAIASPCRWLLLLGVSLAGELAARFELCLQFDQAGLGPCDLRLQAVYQGLEAVADAVLRSAHIQVLVVCC